MGCGNSSEANKKVATPRRRLSIGNSEGNVSNASADESQTTEQDRGLITELNDKDVFQILQMGDGDRKFSIGSETDQQKTSFANKTINEIGDKVDNKTSGLGFTCRKGLKPESPNQDSWTVLKVPGYSLYGVFDGHGQKGHDVSNFVKENLVKLVIKDQRFKTDDMKPMLKDVYKKMQSLIVTQDRSKKLSAQLSGTTCTFVIHDLAKRKLTVSHVADSTCVIGSYTDGNKTKLKGKALTVDHKPDLKEEKARIEKAGGRVVFDGYANHRIYAKNGRYPGLNMSRCLGDILGHQDAGCSAEPDVNEVELGDNDHVLLLCSDGVWEFITPDEAVQIVGQYDYKQAETAANKLAKEAWDRWIKEEGGTVVDDITVVLIYLSQVGSL